MGPWQPVRLFTPTTAPLRQLWLRTELSGDDGILRLSARVSSPLPGAWRAGWRPTSPASSSRSGGAGYHADRRGHGRATDSGVWVLFASIASFALLLELGIAAALVKYVGRPCARAELDEAR